MIDSLWLHHQQCNTVPSALSLDGPTPILNHLQNSFIYLSFYWWQPVQKRKEYKRTDKVCSPHFHQACLPLSKMKNGDVSWELILFAPDKSFFSCWQVQIWAIWRQLSQRMQCCNRWIHLCYIVVRAGRIRPVTWKKRLSYCIFLFITGSLYTICNLAPCLHHQHLNYTK